MERDDNVNKEVSSGKVNAMQRTPNKMTWPQRAMGRMERATAWVARRRLELELTNYGRAGDSLCKQIVNDVEALVYIRRRQHLISAKLKGLRV